MPAFDLDADVTHPLDFALLRDGGLTLFWRPEVLAQTVASLRDLGYKAVSLDAGGWDEDAMHAGLADGLDFPDYYGRNLNALDDCLYDVAHGDYGGAGTNLGVAISMGRFDEFARRDPELAALLADRLATATRTALLFGHRLLWLLQVSDPKFTLPRVGAVLVTWNGQEWLDKSRG